MTETFDHTEPGRAARSALDAAGCSPDGPGLFHTELDANARVVTTIVGRLTEGAADEVAGYLLALPLVPDVVDCRYVHRTDEAGIAALWRTLASSAAVVRPSAAMQGIVATDRRYDVTGIDVPALHRCPTGVGVHDADLRYVYVNSRLASINGVAAERHRNRTCAELLRPSHDTVTPLLRRCLDDRAPIHCIVDTAAESWSCHFLPVCHRIDGREQHFVLALVRPPWSVDGSDLAAPSARLIAKRVGRLGRRQDRRA